MNNKLQRLAEPGGRLYLIFLVAFAAATLFFKNYMLAAAEAAMILLLLMLFGSCAGSTAGGLKLIRVLLLGKLARREIGKAYAPRKVKVIKLDGKSVSEDMLGRIAVYFFIYIAIILFGMLVLAISGCTMTESLSGSISCMSNIGPAFERLGPMANYGWLPGWTKIVLSLIMIAGRLEMYPLLILFAPSAWRKN